ncbi:MAG: glycosyltransferase family 39 protein [Candidatus Acidiferrales bacterium]
MFEKTNDSPRFPLTRRASVLFLLALTALIYIGNAAHPALLDDADASHALVAREMIERHDWVVTYMDGIRYLEKAPLHYWIVAATYEIAGQSAFTTRLSLALAVMGLVWVLYLFGRKFFGGRAGFYAGLVAATSIGMFLFTRIMIPEAIFALELAAGFFLFLLAWTGRIESRIGIWGFAAMTGLAVLTLGLIGVVFPAAILVAFLTLTRGWNRWRELRIFSSTLIFLVIAVPWHLIAEHRSPGFLWSYIVNEHIKRALGTRYPPDYDSVPLGLWWALHLVWLAPWSIFLPFTLREFPSPRTWGRNMEPAAQARLLLWIWAGVILVFFSIESGSRMEYYSFGAWPALAMLLGLGLARTEESASRWLAWLQGALAAVGLIIAAVLGYFVWASLRIPANADIAQFLETQSASLYRLSMAHFLDLTPAAFADLRWQAGIAAAVALFGFGGAWVLRLRRRQLAASITLAISMAVFFFSANSAYGVFGTKLSSRELANAIIPYLRPQDQIVQYGDFNYGSSIPYYTHRHVWIYNGRWGTNLDYGSKYPDAAQIFLDDATFPAFWRQPERIFLFVPGDIEDEAFQRLPADSCYLLAESGGKYIFVNQPLRPGMKTLADMLASRAASHQHTETRHLSGQFDSRGNSEVRGLELPRRDVRRADERGFLVEDDVDRNACEQLLEFFFIRDSRGEPAIFQLRQNFYGNATGDVNSSARNVAHREVAGFRAINIDPQIERPDANRARSFESVFCDYRSRIGIRLVKFRVVHARIQKFMYSRKSSAGQNKFATDDGIPRLQKPPEIGLLLRVRRPVGMSAFRGAGMMLRAVPEEDAFSEPRARRDDHFRRARIDDSLVNAGEFFRLEDEHAVTRGFEIVQKTDAADAQHFGDGIAVDDPGKIRRLDAIADNGAGKTKTRGVDFQILRAQEVGNEIFEAYIFLARQMRLRDACHLSIALLEHAEV